MSYIPKPQPVEFNLYAKKRGEQPLDFNLGVAAEGESIGSFDFKLDEATGYFQALSITNFGSIDFKMDDCVGMLEGKYDSNVRRSLYSRVVSPVKQTKSLQSDTAFLQANATKNIVSALSVQGTTISESSIVAAPQESCLVLKTRWVSLQDSTISDRIQIESASQTATRTFFRLTAEQEVATPMLAETIANYQQLIPIGLPCCAVTSDVNDATHIFNVHFDKIQPPEFQYAPRTDFILEFQPTERVFNQTDSAYRTKNPVEFELSDSVNQSSPMPFELNDDGIEKAQFLRTLFDSVSTYAPLADFTYPFASLENQLTESVQRGGYRLSANVNAKKAVTIGRKSCFKSEATKVLYSQRQPPSSGGGGGGGVITDPPRPPLPPSSVVTFTIPTKTVYQMKHIITATLADLTPLSVDGISLSLDADSWAWQFSCKLLDVNQLPLLISEDGTPVEIIVTINGFAWRVLAEKTTHTKTFARDEIGLSGHSLTALLAPPFVLPRSATQADLFSVQQLAEMELPNGWTLDWQMPTWNVPSGAFSYTAKTPIQVISEIAADIGAVVVPSRNSRTLKIAPRYPVLPWQFDEATPNLVVPDSALKTLTYRAVIPAQANGVYIHGGEVGGVIGWCRLTGTDGGRLSQTVTNSLMTDAVGCRALGERVLAGQYSQPSLQSFALPLNSTNMPLVNVGDLVQVNVGSEQVRGIVNSVSITANLNEVWQTVQIGEETSNVWSVFKQILPREPLLVGVLSGTDGQTSLMTLIDGGVISVRGTGTVGSKYYVRAGRIENEAPNLAQAEIVI
jgi:hypothetical protein